jgi:hypothetical protein
MHEDVSTTRLALRNALGGIIEEMHTMPGRSQMVCVLRFVWPCMLYYK